MSCGRAQTRGRTLTQARTHKTACTNTQLRMHKHTHAHAHAHVQARCVVSACNHYPLALTSPPPPCSPSLSLAALETLLLLSPNACRVQVETPNRAPFASRLGNAAVTATAPPRPAPRRPRPVPHEASKRHSPSRLVEVRQPPVH